VAGGGSLAPAAGLGALEVALQRPSAVAVGATAVDGNEIWVLDANLSQLIRLSPDGTTIASVFDGLANPQGLTTSPGRGPSTPIVADTSGYRIVAVGADGLTPVAGRQFRAGFRGDGGPARRALLFLPYDVARDGTGGLYIADTANERIRFIDPVSGDIDTIAGTGTAGFAGDGGPAIDAQLSGVQAIAISPDASALFIADTGNGRLRRLDLASGVIETVAGSGGGAALFDPALTGLQTPITRISALAVDGLGNAYFPVFWGDLGPTIMRLEPSGAMTRVLGGGQLSAPGTPALDFALADPLGLAVVDDALLVCAADGRVYRVPGVVPVL
jgi:serine/threonine-protein kinase